MSKHKKQRSAHVVTVTAETLRNKGLTRDRANYVMAVIRMRQDVRHLMNTATDPVVVEELLCLDEFFKDSVTTMYGENAVPTQPNPKGAA